MAFGIFFSQLYPKTLYIFISCNSLWVFLFSPVSSWVLTKWPHTRGSELWPHVCLWTGAGCCDLPTVLFFFFLKSYLKLAPPGCCHAAAIQKHKAETRTSPTSPRAPQRPPSASCGALSSRTITISSLLVLFVHVTQSCEGFSRNIGWDSFTKCTLYVFSEASRKTQALSYQFPYRLIVYSLSFSSYLIATSTCVSGVSYHYAVLQKL